MYRNSVGELCIWKYSDIWLCIQYSSVTWYLNCFKLVSTFQVVNAYNRKIILTVEMGKGSLPLWSLDLMQWFIFLALLLLTA